MLNRAVLHAQAGSMPSTPVVVDVQHLGLQVENANIAASASDVPSGAGAASRDSVDSDAVSTRGVSRPIVPLRDAVDSFQRQLIEHAVQVNEGNWAAAARDLGLNRGNLHHLARRLGLKA